MSNAKRWGKIASLTASVAINKYNLNFPEEASMILEELVALCTDSTETLRVLEQKIDAIIIADFAAGEEYLRSATSDEFDYTEKRKLLDKAVGFFTTSYYRLTNIEEGVKTANAGNAAAYCAGIYLIEGKNKLAYDWYLRARKEFLTTLETIEKEKPKTKVTKFTDLIPNILSPFVPFLIIGFPNVLGPGFLLACGLNYLQENSDSFKNEVEMHKDMIAQISDIAKQMYNIAESIKPNIVL